MVVGFPTPRPGHGVVWDDIYVDDFADNIDDLNSRLVSTELDYAEITTASASFTTIVDITGLSVSFTLAATRAIRVDVYGLVQSTVANDRIQLTLADGSNNQVQVTGDLYIPANSSTVPGVMSWRKSLAAGSYTYKVRANRQAGTGTCVVNAATTRPCWIQALDVT